MEKMPCTQMLYSYLSKIRCLTFMCFLYSPFQGAPHPLHPSVWHVVRSTMHIPPSRPMKQIPGAYRMEWSNNQWSPMLLCWALFPSKTRTILCLGHRVWFRDSAFIHFTVYSAPPSSAPTSLCNFWAQFFHLCHSLWFSSSPTSTLALKTFSGTHCGPTMEGLPFFSFGVFCMPFCHCIETHNILAPLHQREWSYWNVFLLLFESMIWGLVCRGRGGGRLRAEHGSVSRPWDHDASRTQGSDA